MEKVFLHSKCCMAHWELTYENGRYDLVCEDCGKLAGKGVEVTGENLDKVECVVCKKTKGCKC